MKGHKPWNSQGILELSWLHDINIGRYAFMYETLCCCVIQKAPYGYPCFCIALLDTEGLPVHRSWASRLPLMYVTHILLSPWILKASPNTDWLKTWAQWLWRPLSTILIAASWPQELKTGSKTSSPCVSASCVPADRLICWATHMLTCLPYARTQITLRFPDTPA